MNSNSSGLIVAGAVALATAAGVTFATMQRAPQPDPATPTSTTSVSSTAPASSSSTSPTTPSSDRADSTDRPPQSTTPPVSSPAPSTQTPVQEEPAPPPAESPQRQVESCSVSMAVVSDPNPPLNVRSQPTTNSDNIVGKLKNGTFLTVVDEQNGWFEISTPTKGWVSKQQTESGCNQKVERVSFGSNGSSATIADRFVGTGSHRYRFSARKGQTMTITLKNGAFPAVFAPSGTVLNQPDQDEQQARWVGQLPQTGDYTLNLDSNFRGYKYSFVVEIK